MPTIRKSVPAKIAPQRQPRLHREGQERCEQCAANGDGRADHRHGAGTVADKPGVAHGHRGVDKARRKGKGNDTEVNDQERRIAIHPGKQDIACAAHGCGEQEHRARTEAVDQIADKGAFESAFSAGKGKRQ